MLFVNSSVFHFLSSHPFFLPSEADIPGTAPAVIPSARNYHAMPPKQEPWQWAKDHNPPTAEEADYIYKWRWDRIRGQVTRRTMDTTGWAICVAAYSGTTEVQLPTAFNRDRLRVHLCAHSPCEARWNPTPVSYTHLTLPTKRIV